MESLEEKVSMFMDYDEEEHQYECDSSMEDLLCSENLGGCHSGDSLAETTLYWESQVALLQEIMERHESTGLKLKQEVGQIIKEVKASDFCSCFKPNPSNCSTCFRRQVVAMLCHKGFNTKLRISKWGTTKKFPGGSHEYIEVIASTVSRKKQITFLVELEFRDQFKIAKAGKAYQKLVSCLPELYVGKQECLTAIVRVMCEAAKKSLKEKKMHIGPWRKSGFMQMKWSGFNQTWTLENSMGNIPANESHLRISGAPSVVVT
ncbi:hypothetical protein PIB30_001866 [Stylosanthes scabra]|uniref:Uncharacterized protein n=1 Tax=Stylosanthes scabra TaxID=79078 RepID=A0ABU6W2K6_9FABA|nr:hypothetical protein [Stylosanthes scabra]